MTQLDIPHSLHFLPPRVFSSFRSNFPPFRINACSEKASRDRARFDSTRGLGTIQEPIPRRPDESKLATYGRGPTYISYISYIIYIIHYIYTHTREREREIVTRRTWFQLCACDAGVGYNSFGSRATGKHLWMPKYAPCPNPKREPWPYSTVHTKDWTRVLTAGTIVVAPRQTASSLTCVFAFVCLFAMHIHMYAWTQSESNDLPRMVWRLICADRGDTTYRRGGYPDPLQVIGVKIVRQMSSSRCFQSRRQN